MALTENGMDTTMLVSPTGGYGGGNGLFGGGDSWLGILFLIALCNGGFGFGGFGGGYGAMMVFIRGSTTARTSTTDSVTRCSIAM